MALSGLTLVKKIVHVLDEKQIENLTVLDMRKVSSIADYFVIGTGSSSVHLKALGDAVDEELRAGADRVLPYGVEGRGSDAWVLYDYVETVVHLFTVRAREYYALERFWNDAVKVQIRTWLKAGEPRLDRRPVSFTRKKNSPKLLDN